MHPATMVGQAYKFVKVRTHHQGDSGSLTRGEEAQESIGWGAELY